MGQSLMPEVATAAAPKLSDLDGLAHAAYGLENVPALILVRPDGHIAFRGQASRPELLRAYWERVFTAPGDSTSVAGRE